MVSAVNFVFLSGSRFAVNPENTDRRFFVVDAPGASRVRASAQDPLAGLRGHDYIKARGLTPQIRPHGRLSVADDCRCDTCERERLLPWVQRICAWPEAGQAE